LFLPQNFIKQEDLLNKAMKMADKQKAFFGGNRKTSRRKQRAPYLFDCKPRLMFLSSFRPAYSTIKGTLHFFSLAYRKVYTLDQWFPTGEEFLSREEFPLCS